MQLVFATHNLNKFKEVQVLVPKHIHLLSLNDIGCTTDIPETGNTLEENAQLKADYITSHYGYSCFADDTGLVVDSLDGAPGIYSARYAGPQKNASDNMDKLLDALVGKKNRKARFKTVIALNLKQGNFVFHGIVEGQITHSKKGIDGFGYDPIFLPEGYKKTFAELDMTTKNSISHRGKAIQQFLTFLKK